MHYGKRDFIKVYIYMYNNSHMHLSYKFLHQFSIEQFSNECRKTKPKVITLANHKGHRQSSEQIKT